MIRWCGVHNFYATHSSRRVASWRTWDLHACRISSVFKWSCDMDRQRTGVVGRYECARLVSVGCPNTVGDLHITTRVNTRHYTRTHIAVYWDEPVAEVGARFMTTRRCSNTLSVWIASDRNIRLCGNRTHLVWFFAGAEAYPSLVASIPGDTLFQLDTRSYRDVFGESLLEF